MLKKIQQAVYLYFVLFITWYVLSGRDEPLFLIFGAVSCALAVTLAVRMEVVDREGHPFHLALVAPFYWLWLFFEMIKSGITVTRIIWNPRFVAEPYFTWIPISQQSDLNRTIYANSATLTPGTVCVNIEPDRIFLHALEKFAVDDLESGIMEMRVAELTGSPIPEHLKNKPLKNKKTKKKGAGKT